MSAFKWKDMSRTRGGRISQKGYLLAWVGFAGIFVGGVIAASFNSPVVTRVVLAVMFAMAFAGLGIVLAGKRIEDRDLAEYHRKVDAGELPKWKPGDPNPLG